MFIHYYETLGDFMFLWTPYNLKTIIIISCLFSQNSLIMAVLCRALLLLMPMLKTEPGN